MSADRRQLERNLRAAQLATERGWLDTVRIDALIKLGEAWGEDLVEGALRASWLTPTQADELRSALSIASTAPASAPQAQRLPAVGDLIGDYVLEERLGSGAMGTVFAAKHQRAGFRHALKLVPLAGRGEQYVQRFLREGEALARISHPGVVRIHACELLPSGLGLLAMDLVQGESLEDWLAAGALPIQAVIQLGAQLSRALEALHEAGIVHRDLKPANVIVRADTQRAVLCDFGVVHDLTRATRLTQSGQLLGSPLYMAPEQILGERSAIGPPTDVFSLGGILYRLLSGEPAFNADSLVELASRIAEARPTPLRSLRSEIPRALARRVEWALARKPADRPSAAELADDLERLARGERLADKTPLLGPLVLACALLILLAAIVALTRALRPDPDPTSPLPGRSYAHDPRADETARNLLEAESNLGRSPSDIYRTSQGVAAWLSANQGHTSWERVHALGERLARRYPLRITRLVEGGSRPGGFLGSHVLVFPDEGRFARWSLSVPPRELHVERAIPGQAPLTPCGPALLTVSNRRLWRWTPAGWSMFGTRLPVRIVFFASPEQGILLGSAKPKEERVLHLDSQGRLLETLVHENKVRTLTVLPSGAVVTGVQAPDGQMAYAGLRVWEGDQVVKGLDLPLAPRTMDAAGSWLAIGDRKGHLFLMEDPVSYDGKSLPLEALLEAPDIEQSPGGTTLPVAHTGGIYAVRVLDTESRLVSFSPGEIAVWNLTDRALIRRASTEASRLDVSEDGRWGLAHGPAGSDLWALLPPSGRTVATSPQEGAIAQVLAGEPHDEADLEEGDRPWARLERRRRQLDDRIGVMEDEYTYLEAARNRLTRALDLIQAAAGVPADSKLAAAVRTRLGETCLDVILDVPQELDEGDLVAALRRLVALLLPDDPRPTLAEQIRNLVIAASRDLDSAALPELPNLEPYGPRWTTLGTAVRSLRGLQGAPMPLGDRFDPMDPAVRGHVEVALCTWAARALASACEQQLHMELNTHPAPAPEVLRNRWQAFERYARGSLGLVERVSWRKNKSHARERLQLARVLLYGGRAKEARAVLEKIPPSRQAEWVALLKAEALLLEDEPKGAYTLWRRQPWKQLHPYQLAGTKAAIAYGRGQTDRAAMAALSLDEAGSNLVLGWRTRAATLRLLEGEPDVRQPLWDALKRPR